MGKIAVNPKILRWARETSHLELSEVARKINKTAETVESWEEGLDSPTYVQLEQLAYKVYKRPLAVFFFPDPPKEPDVRKSFRTLPDFEYDRLEPSVVRIIRQARAMQIKLGELCDGKNPAEKQILNTVTLDIGARAELYASQIRSEVGISLSEQKTWRNANTAFSKWRDVLEKNGVFVFKDAFKQNDVSGFCLYDSEFPVIYVNNSMAHTRQIFTLFHELAHLMYKMGGIDKLRDDFLSSLTEADRRIEIFSNDFAAKLLVPDDDFNQYTDRNTYDEKTISEIATLYSVSREVILRKLLDRGLVDQDQYTEVSAKWIEQAIQSGRRSTGGDYYATKIVYLGDNYLNIVFGQYYKNRIDVYQLSDYLNIRVDNVPTLETAYSRRT